MKLNEVRKEDDIYYQGAFWIKGDSVLDIKRGHFEIVGIQLPTDYYGNYLDSLKSKSSLTHKRLWSEFVVDNLRGKPFNYLPRGRVCIYSGHAFIHIHSLFNQPNIIDTVIDKYNLYKLDINIDLNDMYQGSHYDFLLD